MLALKNATRLLSDGVAPSASSTRASSSVTQSSPPPSAAAASRRAGWEPSTGDVVDGRYVLIEQLGKGGMGVVWKARSTALDVEVAVKLVRSSPTPSSDAFKRMAREAHAAARLGHPAMATVLDFGATAAGDPYVVMELLHGESLGEVLAREQRMDAVRAVSTLLPILDGLREAHEKGIVHRDIKPENLFITKTTRGRLQPKVLDFGIAKLDESPDACRLTQDGAVLGSPGYFSPEQARGEASIDLRTDIWSISVVLYELITGELPFNGANYNALLTSILKDAPKSTVDLGYGDAALWRIVQRGLMRDCDKRWGSMGELGRALAGWLYEQGVTADVTSRSIRDVWLDPRSASEQAPSPLPLGSIGLRRRLLSTIKRRVDDTRAGETLSALIARHRVPARVLGWSAAATGLAAILWSLLIPGGASAPLAHAAGQASGPSVILAPAAAVIAPSTSTDAPAAPPTPDPVSVSTTAARIVRRSPLLEGMSGAPAKPIVATKPVASAKPVASSHPPVAEPSATRAARSPAAPARSAGSATRRGIDREFGF